MRRYASVVCYRVSVCHTQYCKKNTKDFSGRVGTLNVKQNYFFAKYVSSEGRQQWAHHHHRGLKPLPGLNHFLHHMTRSTENYTLQIDCN